MTPLRERTAPAQETITPDPAIAVLPFSVGGDENLDYLRNGMVRLLSTRFDGMGEIRSIDPNALLVQPELEIEDVIIAPGNGVSPSAVEIASFLGQIDDDTNPANGPRDVVEVGFDIGTGDGKTTPYTAEEIEIEEEDD